MPSCIVKNCKNYVHKKGSAAGNRLVLSQDKKRVSYHSFPKDPIRRQKWLDILQIHEVKDLHRICSDHFTEDAFDRTSQSYVKLRGNAIPYSTEINFTVSSARSDFPTGSTVSCETINSAEADDLPLPEVDQTLDERDVNILGSASINCDEPATKRPKIIQTTQKTETKEDYDSNVRKYVDRQTSVSPERIFNSPTKQHVRQCCKDRINKYKRRIRVLAQKLKRCEQKNLCLEKVLQKLKSKGLLAQDQLKELAEIGSINKALFKRQIRKVSNANVPRQYSPELRQFALTLHFYSASAYSYVRRKLNSCLPHPKTISKWYRTINGEPGLCSEALNSIKKRAETAGYPLLGSLMFDGMHIRQMLQKTGNKFTGLVDLGSPLQKNDKSTPAVAKEALVFMVSCINQSWKIPIAYFLIDGLTSKQLGRLISECLIALHESNIKIVSLTFDGTATNLSAARFLISKNEVKRFSNPATKENLFEWWFTHPVTHEEVYIFLDPCHMLKLLRNTLGDVRKIKNSNGDWISWNFFVQLHDLQEGEGMHLANRVRSAHINYLKQKMNVRLAAQLFSRSVADALSLCEDDLKLPSFQNCGATIEFIRNVNDLFDIFNSRNLKSYDYKKALHAGNKDQIYRKLDEIASYIQDLILPNGQSVIISRKKTGFIGFLICINSLKRMYESHCEKSNLLKYVPTYKISQDHLETFFSCIRSHGGHNNNPSAQQFSSAYKKLLLHTDLKAVETGNCIPIEHVSILHVSCRGVRTQSENVINSSSAFYRLCDEVDDNWHNTCMAAEIHSYIPNILQITVFSERIIAYMAGFVVKHLQSKLYCEQCVAALSGSHTCEAYNLILVKNRGGLRTPSDDVYAICKKAEKAIRFALRESGGKILQPKYSEMYLTAMVFKEFIGSEIIFEKLVQHTHDQDALENHQVHLIRCVIQKYIKTRLFYIAKQVANERPSARQFRTNLTQFEGR